METYIWFGRWTNRAERFPVETGIDLFWYDLMKPFEVSAARFLAIFGCGSRATYPVADVVTRKAFLLNGGMTHCLDVSTEPAILWFCSSPCFLSFVLHRSQDCRVVDGREWTSTIFGSSQNFWRCVGKCMKVRKGSSRQNYRRL